MTAKIEYDGHTWNFNVGAYYYHQDAFMIHCNSLMTKQHCENDMHKLVWHTFYEMSGAYYLWNTDFIDPRRPYPQRISCWICSFDYVLPSPSFHLLSLSIRMVYHQSYSWFFLSSFPLVLSRWALTVWAFAHIFFSCVHTAVFFGPSCFRTLAAFVVVVRPVPRFPFRTGMLVWHKCSWHCSSVFLRSAGRSAITPSTDLHAFAPACTLAVPLSPTSRHHTLPLLGTRNCPPESVSSPPARCPALPSGGLCAALQSSLR